MARPWGSWRVRGARGGEDPTSPLGCRSWPPWSRKPWALASSVSLWPLLCSSAPGKGDAGRKGVQPATGDLTCTSFWTSKCRELFHPRLSWWCSPLPRRAGLLGRVALGQARISRDTEGPREVAVAPALRLCGPSARPHPSRLLEPDGQASLLVLQTASSLPSFPATEAPEFEDGSVKMLLTYYLSVNPFHLLSNPWWEKLA